MTYAEAVEARTQDEREAALRRLGDVALVNAGLFAVSLSRKLVDLVILLRQVDDTRFKKLLAPTLRNGRIPF